MPSVSKKQQRFMGAELGRKRAGQKTKTGMSEKQLEEFASKKGSDTLKHKMTEKEMVKHMGKKKHMTPEKGKAKKTK